MTQGRVFLVGSGPGAADLLTVRAVRALERADIVLHDRLIERDVLALAPDALLVDVGKRPGSNHGDGTQERISELLIHHASAGRTVIRLKGGDPMVFGRGAEEAERLTAAGIDVEVIPGLTSAVAVPTLSGFPMTRRAVSSSFTVVSGRLKDGPRDDWGRFAPLETLVVLMGVGHRAEIATQLILYGRPPHEPVAFVERGSTPRERVVVATLGAVAAGEVSVVAPAVWLIGPTVGEPRVMAAAPGLSGGALTVPAQPGGSA